VSKASKRQSGHPSPTCDGPAVALLLHKFIDAFHDMPSLDSDPEADHRCCETCRPKVLRAFKVLEEVLKPCAEDLEDVKLIGMPTLTSTPAKSVIFHRSNKLWSGNTRPYLLQTLRTRINSALNVIEIHLQSFTFCPCSNLDAYKK
jgi:hypothetical protein